MIRFFFLFLPFFVFLSLSLVDHSFAQDQSGGAEREPIGPVRITQRGDYDIEHYHLGLGDLLRFKTRGVYSVSRITDDNLILTPFPPVKRGILADDWMIPDGRIPIGNRNYLDVRELNTTAGQASIRIEYKTRWHWWDAF